MRKFYIALSCIVLAAASFYIIKSPLRFYSSVIAVDEEEENEGYDGPAQRDSLEFIKTMDPSLGYVPYDRLYDAINYTRSLKTQLPNTRMQAAMSWEERGPIYDSLGPSNGNTRAGVNYTAGRIAAVLVDTLNDPTGNTVLTGGIAGGIWRCTNFLSQIPNWQSVNDYMDNLAISSLCQDPAHPNIMYASTGEATSNADAVLGKGIWKSTDAGLTWNLLPSTANVIRSFKVTCDAAGNVYVGARTTATPASNLVGLMRSTDGGVTWTNITPTAQGTATATATCTDLEYTNTGKLIASFGYGTGGTTIRAYTTSAPATVTQSTGWTLATGLRPSNALAVRLELTAVGDIVYGVTVNTSYNTDSCYKSVDGGVTWTKQNTVLIPTGLGSGQGWYNQTLAVNPQNPNELMSGGLDAYRSSNGGVTWQRVTYWVTTAPYVHADHHYIQWWNKNGESRILIGSDGGLFLSRDNGVTFIDKNRNLAIKQFYGGAIHPAAGSPYLIAGAQDNGNHQLKYPGLGPSNEVVGGDGAYVHINQLNPQVQFGAYVYNQYRRSLDGGNTWGSINVSSSAGLFINPFDMDDAQYILYGCYTANNYLRMSNANQATTTNTVVSLPALAGGVASAIKVSPYTANRVFMGTNGGRVIKVDNANATPTATDITGATMQAGYINCVNTGTNDNNLVAVYTNYGVSDVWVTNDAGATWTAIDGNLPDMPVRWALFEPGRNDRLILATEAGIYTTDQVNGASTIWMPNTTFPTVRTDMLKMRISDSTVVAATHGRGLFTAKIAANIVPQVSFLTTSSSQTERTDATSGCRGYADYTVSIGLTSSANAATTVTLNVLSGTATEGADFDITTNGNFTNPSKQISFASGSAATKTFTIRVYDDTEVESLESLKIGFTVNGSNAVAGLLTQHDFNIGDNDRHPSAFQSGNYSLGNYDADLGATSPFNGTKLRHRLQVLYTANELRNAGFTIGGPITAMKLKVKSKASTTPFNGFSISMMHTNANSLTTAFLGGGTIQQVYSANYSTVIGDNNFAFNSPFVWDGSSNILVQFCFDNTGGTTVAVADSVQGMATPLGTGVRASAYSNYTTTSADVPGCFLAGSTTSDNRVNATFAASFGNPIATALNSTGNQYLASRNDLYYYNNAGEIMARVVNLTSDNYGCTQVIIDRAGTGTKQFWNSNTANYLMDKTFRVLPATNAPNGKYEVTFYFTRAEKEGWEQATGQSWNNIQIIKLPSRISNVSPQNAQPDGPGTVEVINAVTRTFGPDFYTLSAVFNSGFSGFGFGVAGRMNTVLTLSGAFNANNRDIDLTWTTSAEINSSVFVVEKSYDGTNFHSIGTVPASVNKLSQTTYAFTDPENVQYNYYRIKMLHTDGYVLYSNIVFLKKDNAPNILFVTPNPFVNYFNVRFSRTPSGPVTFTLYDAASKMVMRQIQPGGSISYNINNQFGIANGAYLLVVAADGQRFTHKLLKK
jgi:hypothetical protein